jgi:hypothetical protein
LTDPDEEIDGISSVSSIDTEVGRAGTDLKKVEAFQSNQRMLVKEKNRFQRNIKHHPATLRGIKERWGIRFDMTKAEVLEELAKVDTEKENRDILMRMVRENKGLDFGGMITEFTDEEIDTFLRAFGDVAALKEREEQEEARRLLPRSDLDQFMMDMDGDYDPDELEKRKREYLAMQMMASDYGFNGQRADSDDPYGTDTFDR